MPTTEVQALYPLPNKVIQFFSFKIIIMKQKKLHKINAKGNTPMILAVTPGGRPGQWIHWKDSAVHYATDDVLWSLGGTVMTLTGGANNNNDISLIELALIISVAGMGAHVIEDRPILLTNQSLFKIGRASCRERVFRAA